MKVRQELTDDAGKRYVHREKRSRRVGLVTRQGTMATATGVAQAWSSPRHYGLVEEHSEGFAIGGRPWAMISISNTDESARHDWREFQEIKNQLLGEEWEAVELYPAESRLKDPSNRFYLWCAPMGVFTFGLPGGRSVLDADQAMAPQRAFPK